MKTIDYVKRYRLNESDSFSHNRFAIDFGNDFLSRLEVYKTFSSWSELYFWKLYDEMINKWDQINKKTVGQLPDKLWNYMRREIFIPTLEEEFPRIKEFKNRVDVARIPDLRVLILGRFQQLSINDDFMLSSHVNDAEIEWDHNYMNNALGELNYKPNYSYKALEKTIDKANDHCLYYAFDELTHQLMKLAAAKAKIQFRIRHEHEQRRKVYRDNNFDWWSFLGGSEFYDLGRVNINDYLSYFDLLKINTKSELTEKAVITSYRQLSLVYHPDKGGDAEKFIELTEAKNKCLEFIKLKTR